MKLKGICNRAFFVTALLILTTLLQAQTGEALKTLGQRAGKMIGTMVPSANRIFNDMLPYREILDEHFNGTSKNP